MIRLTTTTTLLTCMAAPVMADVTAPDVWNGFSTLYQSMGLKVEATQTQDGDTTSIADLKLSGDFPFDLGWFSIYTNGPNLVENGDGTVAIKFPAHMPIAIAVSLPDDLFITANLDYKFTGYTAVASGKPDDFTIEYSADKMALALIDFDGPDMPVGDIEGSYMVIGLTGSSRFVSANFFSFSQKSFITKAEIDGGFTESETHGTYRFSEVWNELAEETSFSYPTSGIDLMNLPKQLRNGLSMQYKSSIGSTIGKSRTTRNDELVGSQFTSVDNSVTTLSLSQSGARLDTTADNYILDYLIEELPFPLKVKISSANGALKLPLLKAPEDQDFTYLLSVDGVTLGDGIWGQFDPEGKLSHAPADMTVDFTGKGKLSVDLLDIDAMTKVINEGNRFGALSALTINNLDVSALGASLISNGAFTFDNNNLESFDGVPAPSGSATMHFAGVNAAIDTLIDIGLLESEQALGVRMGLGMFTVIGERKDTLVSQIEITPDGQVTANGKRLK